MIKYVKSFLLRAFKPVDPVEAYLSQSEDLVDLERRQKELQRKGIWV